MVSGAILSGGSGLTAAFYSDAMFAFDPYGQYSFSYTSATSGIGRSNVLTSVWDFGDSAGTVFSSADYKQAPDVMSLPITAVPVIPVYNLPAPDPVLVTNYLQQQALAKLNTSSSLNYVDPYDGSDPFVLRLSRDVLANIFLGAILYWDNDAIKLDNPALATVGVLTHKQIILTVRADKAGASGIWTSALSSFSSTFAFKIGTSEAPKWTAYTNQSRIISSNLNSGLLDTVSSTAYSLGYSVLSEAVARQIPYASVKNKAGNWIVASTISANYALIELGVISLNKKNQAGGLPGSNGVGLSLVDASSASVWPFTGFSYALVRSNTTRAGQTCASRAAMVNFLLFIYTSPVAAQVAAINYFTLLPQILLDALGIFDVLQCSILCNDGSSAYQYNRRIARPISGGGTAVASHLMGLLGSTYQNLNSQATFAPFSTLQTGDSIVTLQSTAPSLDFAASITIPEIDSILSKPFVELDVKTTPLHSIPISLTGLAVIYRLSTYNITNLRLNGDVLGKIFAGQISRWNDSAIVALNPKSTAPLPNIPIRVVLPVPPASIFASLSMEASTIFASSLCTHSVAFRECYSSGFVKAPADISSSTANKNVKFNWALSSNSTCGLGLMQSTAIQVTYEAVVTGLIGKTEGSIGFTFSPDIASSVIYQAPTTEGGSNAFVDVYYGLDSITACTSDIIELTPDPIQKSFLYGLSSYHTYNRRCWPFTAPISLFLPASYSSNAINSGGKGCSLALSTISYVNWLFGEGASSIAAQFSGSNMVHLAVQDNRIARAVSSKLQHTTCDGLTVYTFPTVWDVPVGITNAALVIAVIFLVTISGTAVIVWKFRRMSILRSSSVPFSLLNLLGCCFFLISAIIFTVRVPTANTCSATVWMAVIGFWLVFSPLFTKTWRVYQIFMQSTLRIVKMSNNRLAVICSVQLALNIILLLVWSVMDPVNPQSFSVSQLDSTTNKLYEQTASICSSNSYTFPAIVLGSMVVLLVVGCVLAFNTRNVTSKFNESKSISAAIYSVTFTLLIFIPIALVNTSNFTFLAVIVTLILIWIPISSWIILFGPKLYVILTAIYRVHVRRRAVNRATAGNNSTLSQGNSTGGASGLHGNDSFASFESDFLQTGEKSDDKLSAIDFGTHVLDLYQLSSQVLSAYIPFLHKYTAAAKARQAELQTNTEAETAVAAEAADTVAGYAGTAAGVSNPGSSAFHSGKKKSARGGIKSNLSHPSSVDIANDEVTRVVTVLQKSNTVTNIIEKQEKYDGSLNRPEND